MSTSNETSAPAASTSTLPEPTIQRNAVVIKAPNPFTDAPRPRVFLAGSIEMGTAEDWQSRLTDRLADLSITILNPRRDDWDKTWEQRKTNPPFLEQVIWELDGLDDADLIALYFDPDTKAPITLLELGLYATSSKMIVCCPDGFYRKGNVEIMCERLKIPLIETWDEFVAEAIEKLQAFKTATEQDCVDT